MLPFIFPPDLNISILFPLFICNQLVQNQILIENEREQNHVFQCVQDQYLIILTYPVGILAKLTEKYGLILFNTDSYN